MTYLQKINEHLEVAATLSEKLFRLLFSQVYDLHFRFRMSTNEEHGSLAREYAGYKVFRNLDRKYVHLIFCP